MKKVKVTIDQMGNPVIEAVGFNGCGCTDATKSIENALGGPVDRTMKPEYNAGGGTNQQHIKQGW